MMSEMGKKRNIKIFSAVIAAIFVFSIAGLAIMQTGNPVNAAPSSNIGVVDTSKIITPDNQDAVEVQKQIQQAGEDMQKQFEQQSAGMDDQQKQQPFILPVRRNLPFYCFHFLDSPSCAHGDRDGCFSRFAAGLIDCHGDDAIRSCCRGLLRGSAAGVRTA